MKKYYTYTVEELQEKSKIPVTIYPDNQTIFQKIADEMIEIIQENNQKSEATVIICPVGPVGQYPFFVERVNQEQIDLKHTWFVNMDEYLIEDDQWIADDHRLSFRRFMNEQVYQLIDEKLVMPLEQRIFPDPDHVDHVLAVIEKVGKVDLVVGGIGINGHIAFNEPDPTLSKEAFLELSTRVATIAPETRTANSIGDLQGALEEMPTRCVTIGFKEIYQGKRIILGCFREWHKGVVRRALCGEESTEFPVTLLQSHPNIQLLITDFVAEMGK